MGDGAIEEDREGTRRARLELIATVVLAIATVLTAWSAFEASKWGGVMSIRFSEAGAQRTESSKATTTASALVQGDLALYNGWLAAKAEGADDVADFYENRFRDEFVPAFDAYLAMNPLENPDAAPGPLTLPEYQVAEIQRADQLTADADASAAAAREANQQGDDYTLTTVIFASVLFFAGVSTKFSGIRSQVFMVTLGVVVLVVTAGAVATFPVEF